MRAHHGQSTVEFVALVGAVAAVLAAAATVYADSTVPQRIAARIGATLGIVGGPPAASAASLAALDAALGADLSGRAPSLGDAERRLAAELGMDTARALVIAEALRRHLPPLRAVRWEPLADASLALDRPDLDGVGPMIGTSVWSEETARGAPTARIVDLAEEERWRARLIPTPSRRVIEGAPRAALAIARLIQPGLSTGVMVADASTAALGPPAPTGIPPGSREDDLVICRPVWRTNRATPSWRSENPFLADRLQLDRRRAALDVRVVRHGRLIARTVLWHAGTDC